MFSRPMVNKYPYTVVVFLFLAALSSAQPPSDQDVPVAPISATSCEAWTNAFLLDNGALEVKIVPDVGRITSISVKDNRNLLRLDESNAGRVPGADNSEWWNLGGDWLWPVAQSRWTLIREQDWPPPPVLATRPWEGRAWKNAAGAQCCLLTREYGAPLHIKVTRLIKLDVSEPGLRIRQRIERTGESEIPVTLWNISQIASADEVVLPVDTNSAYEGGIKPLLFDLPEGERMTACEAAVVYDASAGEHKLCSDSGRAWIAARKGDRIVIEQAEPGGAIEGPWPDGGCRVEMYSNAGLGYTEIETLSAEKNLAVGESIRNTLTVRVAPVDPEKSGCDLSAAVREALGEQIPAAKEPAQPE